MKKKMIFVISAVWLLALVGCGSSREAFLEEYITVAEEIVRKVDANPTADGVKEAQSYLDSRKASLKSKFEAGKKESADKEMEEKFRVIVPYNISKVAKLSEKYPKLKNDLDKLTADFSEFLLKA